MAKVHIRENTSCAYSVDFYPKVCIYCGVQGTTRTLDNSVEYYPKCGNCSGKAEVPRRKRKAVVAKDLNQKKRK